MNKDRWLITVDLDGTTLKDYDPNINESRYHTIVKEAFAKMQELGHIVAINTGRSWDQTEEIYKGLGLKGPIINFAGGHIHDPNDSEFVPVINKITKETLNRLLNDERIKGKYKGVLVKDTFEAKIDVGTSQELEYHNKNFPFFDGVADKDYQSIYFDFDLSYEEAGKLKDGINNDYPDLLVSQWTNPIKEKNALEVNASASNKGDAVRVLAEHYDIPMENTMGFGDGDNDIDMMKTTNVSICMINGKDNIKELATHITKHNNNEGGVGRFLNDWFGLSIDEDKH